MVEAFATDGVGVLVRRRLNPYSCFVVDPHQDDPYCEHHTTCHSVCQNLAESKSNRSKCAVTQARFECVHPVFHLGHDRHGKDWDHKL